MTPQKNNNKNAERFISAMNKIDNRYISDYSDVKSASSTLKLKRILPIAACFVLLLCAFSLLKTEDSPVVPADDTLSVSADKTPSVPADTTPSVPKNETTVDSSASIKSYNGFTIENGVLLAYTGSDTEVIIPDEVSLVSSSAFKNNSSASSIKKLSANKITFEKDSLSPLTGLECIDIIGSSPENVETSLNAFFNCTAEELASRGIGFKLERIENGGTPIYSISNSEGIMLAFGNRDIDKLTNPLTGSETPSKIVISTDTVSTAKGLRTKMTSADAKALNIEWDDVYFTCDDLFYYTVIIESGVKYTYVWEMTEEQNNSFLSEIGINDTFQNAKEKYLKPYLSDSIGVINKITIESTDQLLSNYSLSTDLSVA